MIPIKIIDAVDVYKLTPGTDGFCAVLDNQTTIDISDTYWRTVEWREIVEGGIILTTSKGRIFFSSVIIQKIESF